jgi:hypothetical protein
VRGSQRLKFEPLAATEGQNGRDRPMQKIVIRQANLENELGEVADTVNASFARALPLDRFRWLYQANPDGQATAWVAVDGSSGQIVGTTAVCPRRIRIGGTGRNVLAWNCCDFSIRSRYRTMGAAIKLRRAARAAIDAGDSQFLYAHPNDRMLVIHLQVGHRPLGRMVRHAKLLRTSSGVRPIDRAASVALRLVGTGLWRRSKHDTQLVNEWPLAGLDSLFEDASRRLGTAVVRDSRYLDWRFRQNPLEHTELIVARGGERMSGYLIFTMKHGVGVVKDWLAVDTSAVDALFQALIAEMRHRDAPSISVTALESHRDLPRLTALGFLRRPDSTTAVVYTNPDLADSKMVTNPDAWYMTLGDRDV